MEIDQFLSYLPGNFQWKICEEGLCKRYIIGVLSKVPLRSGGSLVNASNHIAFSLITAVYYLAIGEWHNYQGCEWDAIKDLNLSNQDADMIRSAACGCTCNVQAAELREKILEKIGIL